MPRFLALLTLLASTGAVLVRDAAGLRQALEAGDSAELANDLDLGGDEIVAAAGNLVVDGRGHTIAQHGASHFRVDAGALSLQNLELTVVAPPTAKPTCAGQGSETSAPTPALEPLELLSVTRGGPATRGCGFSESVGAGSSDVIVFGGRSSTEPYAICALEDGGSANFWEEAEGQGRTPSEAWAHVVGGAGTVASLAEAGTTGLVATGTNGAVALLLADKSGMRFVAPDGRRTDYEWPGPTYHVKEGDYGNKLSVLDVRGSGDGAAGAVAVLNRNRDRTGQAAKDVYLEIYAARTPADPLELTASFTVAIAGMTKRADRFAYDGEAMYLLGRDSDNGMRLARLEVSDDRSVMSVVWTTPLGVNDGGGLLNFRAGGDGATREVTVTHDAYYARLDAATGALVARTQGPELGVYDADPRPDLYDGVDNHRITFDKTRDCFYSGTGKLLRRHDPDTLDVAWEIDVAAAYEDLRAPGSLSSIVGVHALSDGRIRLVLDYNASEVQIATLSGDRPAGDRVPTHQPTPSGCAELDAGPRAESCVVVGAGASFDAERVSFVACASLGGPEASKRRLEQVYVGSSEFQQLPVLSASRDGGAVYAYNASVRLKHSVFNGTRAAGAGGAVAVSGGTLEVSGCAFSDVRAGGGVGDLDAVTLWDDGFPAPFAKLAIDDAAFGGAIAAVDAMATVSGSSFTTVDAAGGGGAIASWGGTLEVADSTFHRCLSVGPGGAVEAAGDKLLISGSSFTESGVPVKKTGDGGCVKSTSLSTVIRGTLFERCATNQRPGAALAVDANLGDLTIESSRFLRQKSSSSGALRAEQLRSFKLHDTVFEDNILRNQDDDGGKIKRRSLIMLLRIFDVELIGCTFARNTNQVVRATNLYTGSFLVDRSHFIDNVDKTREGGAALYFHFDPGQLITIKRSSFIGNTIFNQDVQTYGGAIRLTDRATVDSCYFEGNQADEGGAIFVDATAHLSATNTSFVANEASVGGAISACATNGGRDGGNVCVGELTLVDVVGVGNVAKTADRGKSGGGFAYATGAITTFRNLLLANNTAANEPSAVGFFYGDAKLFNVESKEPFLMSTVGHIDSYCSPVTINLDGSVVSVDEYPFECSKCLPGTEWTGAPAYACEPCAPGYSKAPNASACAPCAPGLFQLEPGAAACEPCPSGDEPNDERTACQKKDKNTSDLPDWLLPAGIALLCLVVLAGLAVLAVNVRRFVKKKRRLEEDRALTVQQQVQSARDQVAEFQAHFATIPGHMFVALKRLPPHEEVRKYLSFFDSAADVRDAQGSGLVFMFISHQWLGYHDADPDRVHIRAMREAVRSVAADASVALEDIRVWVDVISIPQKNRSEQRLAIASLPTFASCCQYFVVVAPPTTHYATKCTCDTRSYRRRAWCRAEIMSCWARNGVRDMYVSTPTGLAPLAVSDEILVEALDVFGGDLTCCRLGHKDGLPCDREALMLPMLGLYAEIYHDRDGASAEAYAVIEPHKAHMFPKTFEYSSAPNVDGPGAANPATATYTLFGDLVEAVEYAVDLGRAEEEGDAPKKRARAPDFVPGTSGQRRNQHAEHLHASRSSEGIVKPLRLNSSSSFGGGLKRHLSTASTASLSASGTAPREARPKFQRATTWRADVQDSKSVPPEEPV